jgi:hypothetical protein
MTIIFVFIFILLLIWFARTSQKKITYVNDATTQPKHFLDTSAYIAKGVLTPEFCEKLIEESRYLTYDTSDEPVDEEPVYQVNILEGDRVVHEKLWSMCKDVYHKHKVNKSSNDFMFLKRYLPNERVRIPLHYDNSEYTVSFLLSDTKSFQGCQYYMFDKTMSKALESIASCDAKVRDEFIDKYKNLPIIDYQQGDMVKFESVTHYHGTLPLTGGERYILTIFYEQKS